MRLFVTTFCLMFVPASFAGLVGVSGMGAAADPPTGFAQFAIEDAPERPVLWRDPVFTGTPVRVTLSPREFAGASLRGQSGTSGLQGLRGKTSDQFGGSSQPLEKSTVDRTIIPVPTSVLMGAIGVVGLALATRRLYS